MMATNSIDVGPFELTDRIGEGGMGVVYRAEHRRTGVEVAVKVIRRRASAEIRRQFQSEIRAHAELQHPGVAYLFEYGEIDAEAAAALEDGGREGDPYVAMELADHGTVRDALPIFDWRTVCEGLVQILDILAHAHARGVVHRDLKPENVLVFETEEAAEADWRLKLADFGIAHALGTEDQTETERLESVNGTPHYMAPEQFRGQWREYGPWTDLYALGCVAWELVCGTPPFSGDRLLEVAVSHETDERPPLEPQFPVPDEFEDWIHRAMAIDPTERFRRAADALWALPRRVLAERDAGDRSQPTIRSSGEMVTLEEAPTVDPAARSETRTLAPTLARAETAVAALAETHPEASRPCVEPGAADRATDPRMSEASRPPVPLQWHPQPIGAKPAPLIGAGLGLFELREPPFVDRQDECDRIWEALHEVVEDRTMRWVFLRGEAGTGKSRLAEWMLTRAHEVGAATGVEVIHTRARGSGEGLRGALERTLRTVKLDRGELFEYLRRRLSAMASGGETVVERDARALTEYLRPSGDVAEQVDGPRHQFSSERERRALVVRTLGRLAERRPLFRWIDDLQWGTEAVGMLEQIDAMPHPPPEMLVVATVRSDVVAESPDLQQRMHALERAEYARRMTVEPLSKAHQRELLDELLPLEEKLAETLAERTEGHPLFAMQLLNHWIERGDIEIGTEGFRVTEEGVVELPDEIHQLWVERLERLLETYRAEGRLQVFAALELAAALGREVDAAEWRAVLTEAGIERPPDLVGGLIDRGLAERTPGGWAFAHGLLVESLERISREAGRWRDHHRRCAQRLHAALEETEIGSRERVADHWIEAGEPDRALAPLLEETRRTIHRSGVREARRLLNRSVDLLDELEVPDDDLRRLEQRTLAAKVAGGEGEVERARNLMADVWQRLEADQLERRARTAAHLATYERTLGNHRQSRRWGEEALQTARRAGDDELMGISHRYLAWCAYFRAKLDRAQCHAEASLELIARSENPHERLASLRLRAHIHQARGDDRAVEVFETLRREAIEAGDWWGAGEALNGLGEQARFAGRLEEARERYEEYLRTMQQLARPQAQAYGHLNLAQIELKAGEFAAAAERLRSARRRFETIGSITAVEEIFRVADLTYAAGTGDRERFDELWRGLDEEWAEEEKLLKDHPWLLETAAEYAERNGWGERARELRRLACDLWETFGDEEAADRLE